MNVKSQTSVSKVLIIGLNAVWQRIVHFDHLELGRVQRATKQQCCASGKGANVAIALERLGHPKVHLLQAEGGSTGQLIHRDLQRFKIQTHKIPIQNESRVCTTLLDPQHGSTELIEPSPHLNAQEWQLCCSELQKLTQDPCTLMISGRQPSGPSSCFFEDITSRPAHVKLWVDSVEAPWLDAQPDLLKINLEELFELSSQALPAHEQRSDDDENFQKTVIELMQKLKTTHRIEQLIVTNEDRAGWAMDSNERFKFQPPHLAKVVNVIGAGDSFFAGLCYATHAGLNFPEACDFAARVASTRCGLERVEDLQAIDLST